MFLSWSGFLVIITIDTYLLKCLAVTFHFLSLSCSCSFSVFTCVSSGQEPFSLCQFVFLCPHMCPASLAFPVSVTSPFCVSSSSLVCLAGLVLCRFCVFVLS